MCQIKNMLILLLLLIIVSCKDCQWSTSWYSDNVMECSGVGSCNREKGVCECFDGFEGINCEKMRCPVFNGKECNGHGRCLNLKSYKEFMKKDESVIIPKSEEKYRGCICEIGYSGYSCERKECALGAISNKGNFKNDKITYTKPASEGGGRGLRRELSNENLKFPISITMTNSNIVKSVRFNISESMKAEDIRMRILRENIVHDVGVEKEDPVAGTDTVTITIYYLYDNNVEITEAKDYKGVEVTIEHLPLSADNLQSFAECSGLGDCKDGNCNCYKNKDDYTVEPDKYYETDPYTTYRFKVPTKNCQQFGTVTLNDCKNSKRVLNNLLKVEKNMNRHFRGRNDYNISSQRQLAVDNICIPGCKQPETNDDGKPIDPCRDEYCEKNCVYLCKNQKSYCQNKCPSEVNDSLKAKKEINDKELKNDKNECMESICAGNCEDVKYDCNYKCLNTSLEEFSKSVCENTFNIYKNIICENHCNEKYKKNINGNDLCLGNCKNYEDTEEGVCKGDCKKIKTQPEVTCESGCDIYIKDPTICNSLSTKLNNCKTTLDTCKKDACDSQCTSLSEECGNKCDDINFFGTTLSVCEGKCGEEDTACQLKCINYIDGITHCLKTYSTCISDLPTDIQTDCAKEACKLNYKDIIGSESPSDCSIEYGDAGSCKTGCEATFAGNGEGISKCKASCEIYFNLKGICEAENYFPSDTLQTCKGNEISKKLKACKDQCAILYDSTSASSELADCENGCDADSSPIKSLNDCISASNGNKEGCNAAIEVFNTAITEYETCSENELSKLKDTCRSSLCNEECSLLFIEEEINKCKSNCPIDSSVCKTGCSESYEKDRTDCKDSCNEIVPKLIAIEKVVKNAITETTTPICEEYYKGCIQPSCDGLCDILFTGDENIKTCKSRCNELPTTIKDCNDKCSKVDTAKQSDCLTKCSTYFEDISYCRNSYHACGDSYYESFTECKTKSLSDCNAQCDTNSDCLDGCTNAQSSINTESCKSSCENDDCKTGCVNYFTHYKTCNFFASINVDSLKTESIKQCKINACNEFKKYDNNIGECPVDPTASNYCTTHCDGKENKAECEVSCEFYKKEYEKCKDIEIKIEGKSMCVESAEYLRNEICGGDSDCKSTSLGSGKEECNTKCEGKSPICETSCNAYYEYLSICEETQIETSEVINKKKECNSKCEGDEVECKNNKCENEESGMCNNYINSLEVVYLSKNELLTCSEKCVEKLKSIVSKECDNPACNIEKYHEKCGCSYKSESGSSSQQELSKKCIDGCNGNATCLEICYASYYYDGTTKTTEYEACTNECGKNYTSCETLCKSYYYSSSLNTLKSCISKCNYAKGKCESECNNNIRYYTCRTTKQESEKEKCEINTQSIKACDKGCEDQCVDGCKDENKCKKPNCEKCVSNDCKPYPVDSDYHNNNLCECNEGYDGNKCDKKKCEISGSWFGYDSMDVCSNRGVCNNISGECICENGFNSLNGGCSTSNCANNCNNNGICKYKKVTDKKEGSEVIEEKDVYIGYCDCFDGFEGGSCNETSKKCPKGPLGDGDMPKLKIEFVNGKTAKIIFNNMEYTFDLNSTSCEELVNIFKDNFGEDVDCDGNYPSCTLTFKNWCGDSLNDKIKVEGVTSSELKAGAKCVECPNGKCNSGYCVCNSGYEYDILHGICT